MSGPPIRRFSLLDAMILVAVTAVATAWLRIYLAGINSTQYMFRITWRFWLVLYLPSVVPFATSYSLATLALYFRRPRPPLGHLRGLAGFLTGVVVLLSTGVAKSNRLVLDRILFHYAHSTLNAELIGTSSPWSKPLRGGPS